SDSRIVIANLNDELEIEDERNMRNKICKKIIQNLIGKMIDLKNLDSVIIIRI
ncbi:unnamed protein product, partial [marine sediment metagenome]